MIVADFRVYYYCRIIERKFTKKKFPDKSTKNFFNLYVFLFGIINLLFDDEGYSYKCRLNFSDHFKLLSFWGKS